MLNNGRVYVFASLWSETELKPISRQKPDEANTYLTTLLNKGFTSWDKEHQNFIWYSRWGQRVIPTAQCSAILLAVVFHKILTLFFLLASSRRSASWYAKRKPAIEKLNALKRLAEPTCSVNMAG